MIMSGNTTLNHVALVVSSRDKSAEIAAALVVKLEQAGFVMDQKQPDIVVSIGGDGTMLRAVHDYERHLDHVRFVGVHTGHLGFYTDYQECDLDTLVSDLQSGSDNTISYPMVCVTAFHLDGQTTARYMGLNEATIRRVTKTLVGKVYLNGFLFETFRGDGLSVSTPTGSTAYNKSIGGAVMHPSTKALQMAEIASLNNRVFRTLGAPIVVPDREVIRLELETADDYAVTVDNLEFELNHLKALEFSFASDAVRFVGVRHNHFWHRVKDAFIGDIE
jgi:NAD+ kinase